MVSLAGIGQQLTDIKEELSVLRSAFEAANVVAAKAGEAQE